MAESDVLAAIAAVKAVVDEIKADVDKLFDGTGVLAIKSLTVLNDAGTAVTFRSSGGAGNGLYIAGNQSGHGVYTYGGSTGSGLFAQGGATSGHGLFGYATTSGEGIRGTGAGGQAGISGTGNGSGSGFIASAGATGVGIRAVGGATSGAGIYSTATNGSGIYGAGGGVNHGLHFIGGATGAGAYLVGGATSGEGLFATVGAGNLGDGIRAVGAGTNKGDINADVLGSVSGSVGSLTTNSDKTGYTLTAAYDIPASSVASAVRAELTTELGRIDAAVSSRNAVAPATPLDVTNAQGAITTAIDALAAMEVPLGYTRVTSATYGEYLPGTALNMFLASDTAESSSIGDVVIVAANGSWHYDVPTGDMYTLVARLAGKATHRQAVTV